MCCLGHTTAVRVATVRPMTTPHHSGHFISGYSYLLYLGNPRPPRIRSRVPLRVNTLISTLQTLLQLLIRPIGLVVPRLPCTRGFSFSRCANPTTHEKLTPAMLYRNTAARSVLRAISSSNASVARSSMGAPIFKAQLTSSARAVRPAIKPSFALAAHKPVTTALVRFASSSSKVRIVC
jgi:hypothetical protein